MSIGLQRLSEEDPTFQVSSNEETGQTIIAGMVNFTSKLSVTVCFASSRSKRKLDVPRLLIEKPSKLILMEKVSLFVKVVDAANMVTLASDLPPMKQERVSI